MGQKECEWIGNPLSGIEVVSWFLGRPAASRPGSCFWIVKETCVRRSQWLGTCYAYFAISRGEVNSQIRDKGSRNSNVSLRTWLSNRQPVQ